jgi:S-(hydroxymethyl)glutathione dehydrogenase/alcohol dehydrogenase
MNRLRGQLFDGTSRLVRTDGTSLAMYSMGGLAEYAVVPATDVFALPAGVPLEESCIIGCALMTAYGAIRHQAELRPGESVAVVATGGVGSNLIQLAKAFGASAIIAVDVRPDKLDAARRLGATHTVDASKVDVATAILEHTNGRGVDVAFEALGRPETVVQAFGAVTDGGRVIVVGIAAGNTAAPIEITRLVRRGVRVIGSYGARVRADVPELLRMVQRGVIAPQRTISRRFTLAEVPSAYEMLNRGEIIGRAIVVMAS